MEVIKLEKLIEIIQQTVESNLMVKDFGYGETSDIMNLQTPYVWVLPATVDFVAPYFQEVIYSLDIFCMDRLNKGDNNWLEATSDTLYILQTIIGQIAKSREFIQMGIKIDGDIVAEPVIESTDDNCNGHKITLRLKTMNRVNPCNSPIN
jgi:hypothetical protein